MSSPRTTSDFLDAITMGSRPYKPRRKTVRVRQACDCCHSRKIRCDANDPCRNCEITQLRCTYLSVPKKKGPKGPRVMRWSGVMKRRDGRSKERDTTPTPNVCTPNVCPNIITCHLGQCQLPIDSHLSLSNERFQPSPLISIETIKSCVDGFFAHKYPIMPILDHEQIYATLSHLHDSPEQYGLITALCAVVILQLENLGPVSDGALFDIANAPSSGVFVQETLRARQYCNYIEIPTLASVQTSFFLFAALFCIDKDNSAWFYLREAMTLLQLQNLHEESTYLILQDDKYATNCRRTFWLLFITERAYALQRHRPLTLKRTINLPTVSPGPEATILYGFLDLVSLFQNFDDIFLSLWNVSLADTVTSPQHLIRLQDILKFAIPDVCRRTEIQQADLLVSRQWLKTMVWQLCVSKGLLSSATTNESMSFYYPVIIARDVVVVSRLLPPKAFEAHGVGILEKLFDIGCSLADVLLLNANSRPVSGLEIGPRDYLMDLVRILGTVLGGGSKYLTLLAAKADDCLQVRIRQGLSGCESSSGTQRIEELKYNGDRNKEDSGYDKNDGSNFHVSALDNVDDLENDPSFAAQSQPFLPHPQTCLFTELNPISSMGSSYEEAQLPISPPTPE
ncbi:hypothetical protein V500_00499 [Pseudogymnoascus sp. VKM F-4518 (FW-2643)]|nr:hypothetical protein V500_00499 [Pseudogymnoascus sp. VKM F-4518 (FW-2643)]